MDSCTITTSVSCLVSTPSPTLVPGVSYASPSATPTTAAPQGNDALVGVLGSLLSGDAGGAGTGQSSSQNFMSAFQDLAKAMTIAGMLGGDNPAAVDGFKGAAQKILQGSAGAVAAPTTQTTQAPIVTTPAPTPAPTTAAVATTTPPTPAPTRAPSASLLMTGLSRLPLSFLQVVGRQRAEGRKTRRRQGQGNASTTTTTATTAKGRGRAPPRAQLAVKKSQVHPEAFDMPGEGLLKGGMDATKPTEEELESWTGPVAIVNAESDRRLYAFKKTSGTWALDGGLGASRTRRGVETLWWLEKLDSDGSYKLVNCVSLSDDTTRHYGGSADQYFWLEKQPDSTYHIVSKSSDRALYATTQQDGEHGVGAFSGDHWGDDTKWWLRPQCVASLHTGSEYDGDWAFIAKGDYKLDDLEGGQDNLKPQDIKSIHVYGEDCLLTLYTGPAFDGKATGLRKGGYVELDLRKKGALPVGIRSMRIKNVPLPPTPAPTPSPTISTSTSTTTSADDGSKRPPPTRTTTTAASTTISTTTSIWTTTFTTAPPSQAMLDYGPWGECSQPCGHEGVRERHLMCYQRNLLVDVAECGVTNAQDCTRGSDMQHGPQSRMDNVRCEVEACNRMECTQFDEQYGLGDDARRKYSRKRCRTTAQHGRTALEIRAQKAQDVHTVNRMKCAEACRYSKDCTFFTVLSGEEPRMADVPWCYQEASIMCDLNRNRGLMDDDSWDLYRLSDSNDTEQVTTPAPPRGVITKTVVWRYKQSELVDEDFEPPYIPDTPSAPAAVARGSPASSDVEQWTKLSWDAPEKPAGAESPDILFYKIRRTWWQASYVDHQLEYQQHSKVSESRGPSTTNVMVSGLQAGRTYTFEVCAVNFEGESQWSPKSAPVRMGAAPAKAEPSASTWEGGKAITMTLQLSAETPVSSVAVLSAGGRSATCDLVATKDPHSQFTCLTPAWSKVGDEKPSRPGEVKHARLVAYDVSGFEIATAPLRYADFACPAHSELQELDTEKGQNGECNWYREQGLPTCEVCVCAYGYRKGPMWSRHGGDADTPVSPQLPTVPPQFPAEPTALPEASTAPPPETSAPTFDELPIQSDDAQARVPLGAADIGQRPSRRVLTSQEADKQVASGADERHGQQEGAIVPHVAGPGGPGSSPPEYTTQSRCEVIEDYCRAMEIPNGKFPSRAVNQAVEDIKEVCGPGYELYTEDSGRVQEVVECLRDTPYEGVYGVLGRPQTFICVEVEGFCPKQQVNGGELPFASVHEVVDVMCHSPASDAWPYNTRSGDSPRVTCVANEGDRSMGKFVTQTNEDVSGLIKCAGCPRLAIDSDGERGWISAARVGQRGKMSCPAGWVLTTDFRGKPGPLCTAEEGYRLDNLPGSWNFDDWGGKKPLCVFEDKCKDIDCGDHGQCVIQDEEMMGGTSVEAITVTKKVAKCMCTGGYRGERCERAPPMKCEYQIRFERDRADHQPVGQSIRRQLIEASQDVVGTYKQFLDGDSEKEAQVVKALMTRTARLNNVRVCCVNLDRSTSGKNGYTRVDTDEFHTSIDNVQITTTGTGIEDAMQQLMTEASISLTTKAREKVKESGLSEHQVSVSVKTVTADIEMPVGLPPEGACMSVN
eukprot:TRINITY_DN4255_c0_g1_i4.p1 TRINITY_DN4255_c0_g1~~TRINITY_DN4255_c0_g1_i4.p1  ORF type:complete len:1739 (-),score=319.43 TRINITY_DN4255_c0_g1_i4:70-4893(-)